MAALTKEPGHKPTAGSPSRWEMRLGAACLYVSSLSTKSGSQEPINSGRVEVAFAISEPAASLAQGACFSWYRTPNICGSSTPLQTTCASLSLALTQRLGRDPTPMSHARFGAPCLPEILRSSAFERVDLDFRHGHPVWPTQPLAGLCNGHLKCESKCHSTGRSGQSGAHEATTPSRRRGRHCLVSGRINGCSLTPTPSHPAV